MSPNELKIYEDHPLNAGKKSFRLLHLHPGKGSEQLCATIHVKNLDDAAVEGYTCLSYTWGTEISTEYVKIGGEEIKVTVSLQSFLKHVRQPHETLTLWVDAVCINQNDASEKSEQVAIMGEIYSKCSFVYIWLGAPSSHDSIRGDPFQFIQHFSDNKHYHDLAGYYETSPEQVAFTHNEEFHDLWERFLQVVNSSWFTRAWTVQEVILPRESILCFGDWRSTFDTLIAARRNRNAHLFGPMQCCKESLRAFPKPNSVLFDRFLSQIEWIERFKQGHSSENNPLSSERMPRSFPELTHRPFYEVAVTFSNRLCSEPRDRIYSVLAMSSSSVMKSYRPDYSAKLVDAYTGAFRLMLEETDHDYRCMIGPKFGSDHPGLPSWVPNFSDVTPLVVVEAVLRRILLSSLFGASGRESGALRSNPKSGLSAAGLRVDTVSAVSSELESVSIPAERLKAILMDWRRLCERSAEPSSEPALRTTLARVICASIIDDGVPLYGVHRGWRRIQTSDLPTVDEWSGFLGGNMWALKEGYRGTFELACTGRSLYVTANGKIGLAYPQTKTGDEVWVLTGSRLPFILRKARTSHGHSDEYHFVGDCHLEGIMDGETVEGTTQRAHITLV
ncbi:hypothetical protein MFRU_002g00390 [Monilinia fructicola]|nr:hypothetical protein MFRU_002g00390 [Monilinia fructicola]